LPFGYRRSLLGHPIPAGELGSPHGRLTEHARERVRTPTGLPRSARTSCDRGGCPLYPEDGGAPPGLRDVLSRRLPLHGGQSLHPAPTSHLAGLCFTRHQRGFKPFTRPVFPLPVAARMERAATWASPRGFRTPPAKSRRRTPGVGTGHRARTWNNALRHQPILQSCVFTRLRATSRRTVPSSRLPWCRARARSRLETAVSRGWIRIPSEESQRPRTAPAPRGRVDRLLSVSGATDSASNARAYYGGLGP